MRKILLLLVFLGITPVLFSQFSEKKAKFQKFEGLFPFYYDSGNDKIFLEVSALETEFLYVYSLSSGVGSNDLGLDRGQLGNEQVVFFRKAGNKLLLIQPNLKFRALTDNLLEKKSVEQAFAKSVLYGFVIEEEKEGKYAIDITDFLLQDVHGVVARLKQADQGTYSLDKSRSAVSLERTKAFPRNIEFDMLLTFKGEPKGEYLRSVTPNPELLTVAQHHSFIELPAEGYQKRLFDPRCGSYPFAYYDYSTPVQQPILKRYITRHRLNKKDPEAELSEAVEPIVYYLDNGTPEPIRSALLEGGKWWNEAFESIGFKDAFQLKILPDDADPLDVRYNVIQWVHRSTRGWSYGSSITDPRTGEIIKGHVSLGSLRIRQDFLIAQALMNKPFAERNDNDQAMMDLALARIRQLSAHEIGHTLGFAHNFAASTNDRASVMDYPHPQFRINKGEIDFSDAYDTGIGDWDKVIVGYSYTDIPDGNDPQPVLNGILSKAQESGLLYISDEDARAPGGAHATAHLWDNGNSAAEELEEVLKIRTLAIDHFSIDNIRTNEPNSVLEDVFAPLYFFHRYQTEAVAKVIGGLEYYYAVKGDGQEAIRTVSRERQASALRSILKTLDANIIALPESKLGLFPPRAIGYERTRESFKGKTGISFDALSAAETAVDMTLGLLLHPERASRLIQQKALDDKSIGLEEVLDALLDETIFKQYRDQYMIEVGHLTGFRTLYHIMVLASSDKVHPQVNMIANEKLLLVKNKLEGQDLMYAREIIRKIDKFYEFPAQFQVLPSPKIPDGSPIGMDCLNG